MNLEDFTSTRSIPLGHVCRDLLDGRVLTVHLLETDRIAIRLRYDVFPALPRSQPGGGPIVMWWTSAVDDLGNEYLDGGGAYGFSPDGARTQGTFSLSPLPAAGAASLRITVGAALMDPGLQIREERQCTFDAPLHEP
jgi:hypothetical protein